MEFNYNVESIAILGKDANNNDVVGFLFNPSTIKIIVGDKQTLDDEAHTEVVNIQTVLRENIDGGYNEQARAQQLPASILAAIDGFDTTTMQPTINDTALSQILAGFNLKLK